MPFTSREAIFSALFDLLCATKPPIDMGPWVLTSRDLQSWNAVQPADQPALFLVQTQQHASMDTFSLTQWKLTATAVIYYRTESIPDSRRSRDGMVNDWIDLIDRAINPQAGMTQTLGGLVLHTYIDGAVVFDNGLTDQQAFVLLPIAMLIGAFGA